MTNASFSEHYAVTEATLSAAYRDDLDRDRTAISGVAADNPSLSKPLARSAGAEAINGFADVNLEDETPRQAR